jgi:hypothetical protein
MIYTSPEIIIKSDFFNRSPLLVLLNSRLLQSYFDPEMLQYLIYLMNNQKTRGSDN